MSYEVEQKFPCEDLGRVENLLRQLGASWSEPVEQVDTYFAHPCRDFSQTDEALRVRQVGDKRYITYKGPKLDNVSKTRREIELWLTDDEQEAGRFLELLAMLGFHPAGAVRKWRRAARLRIDDADIEVALDEVEQLGAFVEIEVTVADALGLDAARRAVQALADRFGLHASQRRSYLELLLDKRG